MHYFDRVDLLTTWEQIRSAPLGRHSRDTLLVCNAITDHNIIMSTPELALVPLVGRGGDSTSGISSNRKPSSSRAEKSENITSGSCIGSGHRKKRPRRYRPYMSLLNAPIGDCQTSGSGNSCAVELGRTEILTSTYAACGCLDRDAATASGDTVKKSGPELHEQKNEKKETGHIHAP